MDKELKIVISSDDENPAVLLVYNSHQINKVRHALQSKDWENALWTVDQRMRNIIKYDDERYSAESIVLLESFRQLISDIMYDYDLTWSE